MTFQDLDLVDDILDALDKAGYENPTPIQEEAIPALLDGRDVLAVAQTGTGKTAAFSLPILNHLAVEGKRRGRPIAALIVTPTRELAAQIGESIETYAEYLDVYQTVIFGGVKQGRQVKALERGVDILVATPGRLLDLMEQGHIDLRDVEYFVLDEADRMLDMGFIHDVRRILKKLPDDRQNLLFSATMPKEISDLSSSFLDDPVHISIAPDEPTVEAIQQTIMFVAKADKKRLLPWVVENQEIYRAIVFTRTKHGANRLVKQLDKHDIPAAAIHGNKSQGARQRALANFKKGDIQILVATDIASRGIDIEDLDYVFNYDLPNESESYVHRIGRTGRAGRDGVAISFCEVEEGGYLRDIERLIGFEIEVNEDHPYHDPTAVPDANATGKKKKKRGGGGGGGGNRGGRGRGRGGNSRGNRGGNSRGGNSKGGSSKGGNSKGGSSKGGSSRGGNSKGGNSKGGNSGGNRSRNNGKKND